MAEAFKYIEQPPTPALTENYYTHTTPNPYYDHRHEQTEAPDDRRLDKDATKLWMHLQACHPYKKYRMRQPKETSSTQEQKWPEFMEKAFCRALVKYRPMGRRKKATTDDHKLRGRNELIADAIQRWTGEARTRKQVSSHIQVLKPMVKDDPVIMKYLSKDDVEASRHQHRHRAAAAAAAAGGYPRTTTTPGRLSSHRSSHYDTGATTVGIVAPQAQMSYLHHHNLALSSASSVYGAAATMMSPGTMEPLTFSMFVQQMLKDREP
ncbi:hypothetical protein LTS18_000710, partial [Coniosporium uncinatum]